MANSPTPPPLSPGYFERRAAIIAAKVAAAAAPSTSTSTLALPPPIAPLISFTDTISDISPYILVTLDLATHNYCHWRHLFDVHLRDAISTLTSPPMLALNLMIRNGSRMISPLFNGST
jgi:hypothetical protein